MPLRVRLSDPPPVLRGSATLLRDRRQGNIRLRRPRHGSVLDRACHRTYAGPSGCEPHFFHVVLSVSTSREQKCSSPRGNTLGGAPYLPSSFASSGSTRHYRVASLSGARTRLRGKAHQLEGPYSSVLGCTASFCASNCLAK